MSLLNLLTIVVQRMNQLNRALSATHSVLYTHSSNLSLILSLYNQLNLPKPLQSKKTHGNNSALGNCSAARKIVLNRD